MLARRCLLAAARQPGLRNASVLAAAVPRGLPALAQQARPALAVGCLQIHRRGLMAAAFLDEASVTDRVLGCLKNFQKVDPTKVSEKSHFMNDLGLDSLDTVEVVMAFEDEFAIEIPDADAEKIHSCDDAIKYVLAHPHAK
jgi:NADH dehydrogenase (ubiquinone) 1 alpha/beta subcomplex 1